MARKTKDEALKTRTRILDVARHEFSCRGVAKTSLEQIAQASDVTRGAIYWNFENKTDLFFEMRNRVTLPLFDQAEQINMSPGSLRDDPLGSIEKILSSIIEMIDQDESARETYEIIHFKCEYVGEFVSVLDRMASAGLGFIASLEQIYQRAATTRQLRASIDPALAATETYLFITGLVRHWLADRDAKNIRLTWKQLIQAHIRQRRPD